MVKRIGGNTPAVFGREYFPILSAQLSAKLNCARASDGQGPASRAK